MAKARTQKSLPKPQVSNGYSPKEAALILGERFDGKKIRRLLRKGSVKGTLIGGRWYIPTASIRALLKKAQGSAVQVVAETPAPAESKSPAAAKILAEVQRVSELAAAEAEKEIASS